MFKVGDKVKINNSSNPKIHNKTGIIRKYDDFLDMFNLQISGGEIFIKSCFLEKIDDEEELTKKCLFKNADALDTYIGTIDNTVCLSTISNDVSTWSGTIYKGNDCVMPTYTYLKESEENKMKEIKNQKVVDLYFERKKNILEEEYRATQEAIIEADKNYIFVQQLKDQLNKYVEENEIENIHKNIADDTLPLTEETEDKRDEAFNDYKKKTDGLNNLKEEIIALLSGCDTYEQEMEILQTYKIVNYNTHYVSMNKIREETN